VEGHANDAAEGALGNVGVIDLHCHILPGLDDGARSLKDSVAMARQAEEDGIVAVCATPHVRHDHNVPIEEIASRVSSLQDHLAAEGIDVRVLPGGELAQTEADRLTDAQLRLVALGGAGGWVLLEPAPGPLGQGLQAVVERLAQRGLKTVVAHPERHAGSDFEQRLQELAANGCLIQWTAEFIAGAAPGDLVLTLAGKGLVHLLGSDAHSSFGGRPVRLAAGFTRLATVLTAERIAWTVELAPRAIVRGESVTPPP
jgi:protein-tyrosine phosphatase